MEKCKHINGFEYWNNDFGYYKSCNKCGKEFYNSAPSWGYLLIMILIVLPWSLALAGALQPFSTIGCLIEVGLLIMAIFSNKVHG